MRDPVLILSNPPQTEPEFQTAAPLFGLSAAEVRMKANYGIPEIWFADPDEAKVAEAAENLQHAGFRVCVQKGADLASLPEQLSVKSFSFTDSSLVLNLDDTQLTLHYDAPFIAVLCQPRNADSPGNRSSSPNTLRDSMSHGSQWGSGGGERQSMHELMFGKAGKGADDAPFLDIFSGKNGSLVRASLFQDIVDFSGLPTPQSTAVNNMALFVKECETRFGQAQLDKRLVGMRLRKRPTVSGVPGQEEDPRRRLYSFATTALSTLLESISNDLKDLPEPDLSSRLVYLTRM